MPFNTSEKNLTLTFYDAVKAFLFVFFFFFFFFFFSGEVFVTQ